MWKKPQKTKHINTWKHLKHTVKYHSSQKIQYKVFQPLKIPMARMWAVFRLVLQELEWKPVTYCTCGNGSEQSDPLYWATHSESLHCTLNVTLCITSSLRLVQVRPSPAAPWGFGGTVSAKFWRLYSGGRDLHVLLSCRKMGHFASRVYRPHTV